jgi:hypothetical protein
MKNISKLETAGFATWGTAAFWAPRHHSKEQLIFAEAKRRQSEQSSVAAGLGCRQRQRLEAKANHYAFFPEKGGAISIAPL